MIAPKKIFEGIMVNPESASKAAKKVSTWGKAFSRGPNQEKQKKKLI